MNHQELLEVSIEELQNIQPKNGITNMGISYMEIYVLFYMG